MVARHRASRFSFVAISNMTAICVCFTKIFPLTMSKDMSSLMDVEDINIPVNNTEKMSKLKIDMSSPMEVEDINIPAKNTEKMIELKNPCSIMHLPNESLVEIFSYLPTNELLNVGKTCTRFKDVSLSSPLWRRIHFDESVRLIDAKAMLKIAGPNCRELILENRNDTDKLLHLVSKLTINVQSIKISKCRGSKASEFLRAKEMCNLASRLKGLQYFHVHCTRFRSCKFFRMIAKDRYNMNSKSTFPVIYTGPVNNKQLMEHFKIIFEEEEEHQEVIRRANENPGIGFVTGRLLHNDNGSVFLHYDLDWKNI